MKKSITFLILSFMILTLSACQSISENVNMESDANQLENIDNNLAVEIVKNNTTNEMSMSFSPKLTGEHEKEIQYRWILEENEHYDDFIGFLSSESNLLKEVVNSGEAVELALHSEIMWDEETTDGFKVKLQVEEKDSSTIIASDEVDIEYLEFTR